MSEGRKRWRRMDATAQGGEERKEGMRSSLQFMALSLCSEDSSLGVGWGGLRTLSPCPALYSPGYCSQINAASYPSQSAWLSRP